MSILRGRPSVLYSTVYGFILATIRIRTIKKKNQTALIEGQRLSKGQRLWLRAPSDSSHWGLSLRSFSLVEGGQWLLSRV